MKPKAFYFLTFFAIIGLAFLIIFITINSTKNDLPNDPGPMPKVFDANEETNNRALNVAWNTYENTKYNYEIEYPESVELSTTDEYSNEGYIDSDNIAFYGVSKQIIRIGALGATTTNLLDYANYFRDQQLTDDMLEINTKNSRIVGELSKTEFNGRVAYQMLLSAAVRFEGWGSVIGENDEPFVYIITENTQGEKFVVAYRAEFDMSKKILDTFRYTK